MTSEEYIKLRAYNKGVYDLIRFRLYDKWSIFSDISVFFAVCSAIFIPIIGVVFLLLFLYCRRKSENKIADAHMVYIIQLELLAIYELGDK